ncbi:hypothetical protein Y1Q_0000844 [Alligator mississippiensis]|uniref:Reverse transcriptase domain-containing protein n=1 Tax=Alligator mississippiensis TaxID=8496 RepID=A0A151NJI4_ALLMI|nr:hypothetical protein Y1Q_0000844 [Alligator mississippiensis]
MESLVLKDYLSMKTSDEDCQQKTPPYCPTGGECGHSEPSLQGWKRIDELVEEIGHAKYISTLDLAKGYWQIPLDPASHEMMAFTTLWRLCHF